MPLIKEALCPSATNFCQKDFAHNQQHKVTNISEHMCGYGGLKGALISVCGQEGILQLFVEQLWILDILPSMDSLPAWGLRLVFLFTTEKSYNISALFLLSFRMESIRSQLGIVLQPKSCLVFPFLLLKVDYWKNFHLLILFVFSGGILQQFVHPIVHEPPENPCRDRQDDTYPNPDDCQSYIQCFNGFAYYMTCPKGTAWNQEYKRCTFPSGIYSNTECQNVKLKERIQKNDGQDEELQEVDFGEDGIFMNDWNGVKNLVEWIH